MLPVVVLAWSPGGAFLRGGARRAPVRRARRGAVWRAGLARSPRGLAVVAALVRAVRRLIPPRAVGPLGYCGGANRARGTQSGFRAPISGSPDARNRLPVGARRGRSANAPENRSHVVRPVVDLGHWHSPGFGEWVFSAGGVVVGVGLRACRAPWVRARRYARPAGGQVAFIGSDVRISRSERPEGRVFRCSSRPGQQAWLMRLLVSDLCGTDGVVPSKSIIRRCQGHPIRYCGQCLCPVFLSTLRQGRANSTIRPYSRARLVPSAVFR